MRYYQWCSSNGFFYKVTYSPSVKRAHVYNYGCNLRCAWCFYRLKPPVPDRVITEDEIMDVLAKLRSQGASRVNFLGGEPTINSGLSRMVEFAAGLGYRVKVITNGSNELPRGVHEANVSIKAVDDSLLERFAGCPASRVLNNFRKMYESGVKLQASTIYIPGLTESEVLRVAEFIAEIDPEIPFHIIGYVPVPNAPWRKPSSEEVRRAAKAASRILKYVSWSNINLSDLKYDSIRVL